MNTWMNNPQYLSQLGHSLGACLVMVVAAMCFVATSPTLFTEYIGAPCFYGFMPTGLVGAALLIAGSARARGRRPAWPR